MPTIAGPSLSSYKHIVAAGSEKLESNGSAAYETARKRKLRSDSVAEAAAVSLLPEISVSTPKKWKSHRRIAVSNPRMTEKEVKEDSNENLAVENLSYCLGSKSNWNPKDEDQTRAAKEALHVSKAPSIVVCREDEQSRVFEFVKGCIEQQKAGSLYICGCPGTGKSLSMEKVVQQVGDWSKQESLPPLDALSVNCTSLTKITDIFIKIIICSAAKASRGSKKDATIVELNKLYLEICKSWMISPAGITEFTNMCTVLNDQGILKFGKGRGEKLKRVSLRVDESDITFALQANKEYDFSATVFCKINLIPTKANIVYKQWPTKAYMDSFNRVCICVLV